LGKSTRETIQDETTLAIISLDGILNQVDDKLIADKATRLHDGLGLLALKISVNGADSNQQACQQQPLHEAYHQLQDGTSKTSP
jgi:hypothetical protein